MVERGTWVALALLVSITGGCPQPEDEAGDDEVGDPSTGESGTGDSSGTEDESGVIPNDDDLTPPDDANPESESESTSEGEETSEDEDEDEDEETQGDVGDQDESEGGADCWDLSSADGTLPMVIVDDTSNFADDQIGSCGQFPAPDFSFGFEAPFTGEFVFDTTGSSFDTVLYVDDGECGIEELSCNDDFIGLRSRIVLPLNAGQLVTVVVDGFDADQAGPFQLTIDEYQPPTCIGETIAPPLPKIVLGNTTGGTNQRAGGCGGATSPDDMYRFTAPGPGLYRFHTFGSAFDTVLYVWDQCDGPELGCSDDANLELQSEVVLPLEGGQQVWVVVDGIEGAAGPYQLNVQKL